MPPRQRLIVDKESTADTTVPGDDTDTYFATETETEAPVSHRFKTIQSIPFKPPPGGTVQDNMSIEDIQRRLEGYVPLKTMAEKNYLTELPLMRTWVRYYNTELRKFRTGGILMKVSYPDYIVLVSTGKGLTWSVQLRNNVIFVPDPELAEQKRRQEEEEEEVKNQLYELYLQGKLKRKR